MTKKENPAVGIVKLFDPKPEIEVLPYCETGKVISPLPDLQIQVRDNIYKTKNIKLDEYWVKGHRREIEIETAPMKGSDSDGDSHSSGGFPKAYMIFKDELKVGDQVATLQSQDKQTLYVVFKIARW